MADGSRIEWTEATWNPVVGCSLASLGCTNCYAMPMARRIEAMQPGSHYAGTTKVVNGKPVWSGWLSLAPEHILTQPLRWRRPRRIFVNSMGDLFHEAVPDEWIDQVFAVMALCPQHTFQVLTKRSARMREYIHGKKFSVPILGAKPLERVHLEAAAHMEGDGGFWDVLKQAGNVYSLYCSVPWPLPNVWLGVSTEDQRRADERVPDLLETPAAVRFVSAEPLLGPLRLDRLEEWADTFGDCGGHPDPHWPLDTHDWTWLNALTGNYEAEARSPAGERRGDIDVGLKWLGGKIDLVIVGGESGPNARPMHPDWARSLRDQCAAAHVPFFFKQWGEYREFDTGPPPHHEVEDDSDAADAYLAAAINPSWITSNGRHITSRADLPDDETPCRLIERVGKHAAGRLLDGVEHNAMPEVRP